MTETFLVSATKNMRKQNQHFKLLCFTINLHFATSNQVSTYRKLNLSLIIGIYLVFLPLQNEKETQTAQTVPHVFLLV